MNMIVVLQKAQRVQPLIIVKFIYCDNKEIIREKFVDECQSE